MTIVLHRKVVIDEWQTIWRSRELAIKRLNQIAISTDLSIASAYSSPASLANRALTFSTLCDCPGAGNRS